MAVTIKDVARDAGVTIGTVSRAINGYKDISPATKERVFASIERLGYTPNLMGRGLSSKNSSNIGFIVSGLLDSSTKDTILYMTLQGVYQYVAEKRQELSVYPVDTREQHRKAYTKFCWERNLSGVILSGLTLKDPYLKELVESDIPCVLIDIPAAGRKTGSVSVDNVTACCELMEALFDCGHREFVIISGAKNAAVTIERLAGMEQGMRNRGLVLHRDCVAYCDFQEEKAYQAAVSYLKKYGKTAGRSFVCMSDIMAFGVIRAIKECGYRVPEDFSVSGFDDNPISAYIQPTLTTVRQDFVQFGYMAAQLLKDITDGKTEAHHVYLPHTVIIRDSTRIFAK